MDVKWITIQRTQAYPQTAHAIHDSYVDDSLTERDSVDEAMELQSQLQEHFAHGGFLWKSSEPVVLRNIPLHMLDQQPCQAITHANAFAMVVGVELNAYLDCFCLMMSSFLSLKTLTKRCPRL